MLVKLGGTPAAKPKSPRPSSSATPRPNRPPSEHKPLPEGVVVFDNTRLGDFKSGPRTFYYKHIRNWVPEGEARAALTGGIAWSVAMDTLWAEMCGGTNLPDVRLGDLGWDAFCQAWASEGLEHPDALDAEQYREFGAYSPNNYYEMLLHYVVARRDWLAQLELVGVELPVVVPLPGVEAPGRTVLYGARIDKVMREGGAFKWVDHKTTAKGLRGGAGFQPFWLDQWTPNSQADGYSYAIAEAYPGAAEGGLIDAALVHRESHDQFTLLPQYPQDAMLEAWKAQVSYWASLALDEMRLLDELRDSKQIYQSSYMPLFPCDGSKCAGWGSCPYRDICRSHPNPERLDQPPAGYVEEKWEPFSTVDHEQFGAAELQEAEEFREGKHDGK